MVRCVFLSLPFILASSVQAWAPMATLKFSGRSMQSNMKMALDYNDPVVAEEFGQVQAMSWDEVEEELQQSGVRGSPDMNEMDLKLMLVELRMRLQGKMPDSKPKKTKPAKFGSKFEEALWTKPVFEEFYESIKSKGDHNAMNVVAEYVNDPAIATGRYGKDYKRLLRDTETALNAKAEAKSPTIEFKGFPANMGEVGCKMTLEALGPIVEFECIESDDLPILEGRVTFEDIDTAKKAIEQYDGMDMGLGTSLEMNSV